jgi:glutaconate CoA-transferase subunit A
MSTLAKAASLVDEADTVAFGGKTLHRTPTAFVRELARQGTTDLTVIGVANSMDVDLLAGLGSVEAIHYGYVGFEGYGLAPNFRREVEAGRLEAKEGTCYTTVTMLRGAKQGIPFMPVAGLTGSELSEVRDDFKRIECPFTEEPIFAVRTVKPDVAVVHATAADKRGNARFYGADLTENTLAKAADTVVVTAERVVDTANFRENPGQTDIPSMLVDNVVEVPYGAHPCSCPGEYDYDAAHLEEYLQLSAIDDLETYVDRYLGEDEATYRERAVADREQTLSWDGIQRGKSA